MTQKIFAAQSIKPLPERRGRLRRHKTWMTASIIGTVLSALIAQATGDAEMRERASSKGLEIRAEDGVSRAVEVLQRYMLELKR